MNSQDHIDLTSWIHEQLKTWILEHRLKPGQKIIQEEIAKDLGVSRTPVLKVLQMLESEYLVQNIPRRGYYVREISTKEMMDVFDLREVLERFAVRLVASKAKDSDIESIKDCFLPFMKPEATINFEEYEKADQRFHRLIKEKSGNILLSRIELTDHVHILAYQRGLLRPPIETLPEHEDIIKALENRNADAAEEAMRLHIRRSRESLEENIM